MYLNIWPLIYDLPLLERSMAMCRVHWGISISHAELQSMCSGSYRAGEGTHEEVFYHAPSTALSTSKAVIAVRFPHLVQIEEVMSFLPTAERQCCRDVCFSFSALGPTLSLLCSICARLIGDGKWAGSSAKGELSSNLNPTKQLQSHIAAGVAWSWEWHEDDDDDNDGRSAF